MLISGSRVSRFRHSSRLPFHSSARVTMRPNVAAGDPGHDPPTRKIQGDDQTRPVAKDLPDDRGVVAVGHPRRPGRGEAHPGSEHGRVRGSPTRSVVEPVELDMRNAQIGCEPRREGGLARTCIAGDQQSGRHAHAGDGTAVTGSRT